jgi:hypothetical protein
MYEQAALPGSDVGRERRGDGGVWPRDVCEGNWAGDVPEVLHHAHWQAAYRSPKAKQNYPDRDYFKTPQVWQELSAFYEAQLERTPQSKLVRTCYMLVAAYSEHWDVANEQLKKMGNRPSTRIIREATAEMQKEIEAHATSK